MFLAGNHVFALGCLAQNACIIIEPPKEAVQVGYRRGWNIGGQLLIVGHLQIGTLRLNTKQYGGLFTLFYVQLLGNLNL